MTRKNIVRREKPKNPWLTEEQLEELVEEATVDCYDQYEQRSGLLTMIEDSLECPFVALVMGEEVTVIALDYEDGGIQALCSYKEDEHWIDITSLTWPEPPPEGYQWVEALRHWSRYQ